MKRIIITLLSASLLVSCTKNEGETVESAYIDPRTLPVIWQYSFSRNGSSSVDVLECSLVKEPLDRVYASYLKGLDISTESTYQDMLTLYQSGLYQISPEAQVATSPLHISQQESIKNDIMEVITQAAVVAGKGESNASEIKNRDASDGVSGTIGYDGSDKLYVNEKGVELSEVFNGMIMGAIYLDKILNYHLNDSILNNETLRTAHENTTLPPGRNYTELEHHWDLAYGYFAYWRSLSQAEGVPVLRNTERNIFNAFVQGRTELSRYRYDAMKTHLRIIRQELSRVAAARAMYYLTSQNTLVNLREGTGTDAFLSLSKSLGLIYALQFTRSPEGNGYFSYAQAKRLQALLTQNGFWKHDLLLSDAQTEGSLLYIATEIGKPLGISLNDVQR